MTATCRAPCFLALVPFVLLSTVNAEQEPDSLCLLQTGANLQRSSMPSDFFEVENLAPSSNSAAARFDVGSNVVPSPKLKERLSLTQIDTAAKEYLPEQHVDDVPAGQLSKPTTQVAQAVETVSVEPPSPAKEPPAQAMEVVSVEPPAPAIEPPNPQMDEVSAEILKQKMEVPPVLIEKPRTAAAQTRMKKDNTHVLYDEETADAAAKFVEQQAEPSDDDSVHTNDEPRVGVETTGRLQNPLAALLQAKIKETAARKKSAKPVLHQKLFKDFLRDVTAEQSMDSDASRIVSGSAMHIMPREPEILLDLPRAERDLSTEASTGGDLRESMARVNEDERKLLDALNARRERARDYAQ